MLQRMAGRGDETLQPWIQVYDPLGALWLSALAAAIPIIFFFIALTAFNLKGHVAGTLTALLAVAIAVAVYGMPFPQAIAALAEGFAFGLWPIAWIVIGAVFLFKLTVRTGQFEIIRSSIVSVTSDQRLQALLIAFSFGAFLEGAAGFGAPVAITAALLVGLGFKPLNAAGLCLIANTAPVAFGAMGIPILVAASVSGVDAFKVGAEAGRVLSVLILFVPFWIVAIMDGWRGVKETFPAALVAGVSFVVGMAISSNFVGPELPAIIGAVLSMACLTLFLKVWRPKRVFRFVDDGPALTGAKRYAAGEVFAAWLPFIILTVVVTVWNLPFFKALTSATGGRLGGANLTFAWPYLDQLVMRAPPVAPTPTPYPALFSLNVLSATGTAIFFAAVLSLVFAKRGAVKIGVGAFFEVLNDLKKPIWTIGAVVAFGYVCNYSGMSTTLALLLSGAGDVFTFLSPIVGWIGVFLTGSDTSSNALFCGLQAITAHQIGVPDVVLVAANSTGGTIGKMISPQSIAVATAAVGLVGYEGSLFRFTLKHSLLMVVVVGLLTALQAHVLTGTIP
jgi:L-lactate transport